MEQKIIEAYIAYVLEHSEQPPNVHAFAQAQGMDEGEFYRHFTSFDAIDNKILQNLFVQTRQPLENDEVFKSYSAREKILAFFYAWAENARKQRSFLLHLHNRDALQMPVPGYLNAVKEDFKTFVQGILKEGIEHHEITPRKFISDKYADGLWLQFAFIHQYWLKDTSKDFENTDTAIEKSLQLAFELMGKGVLDAAIDFGKFLFQNRK